MVIKLEFLGRKPKSKFVLYSSRKKMKVKTTEQITLALIKGVPERAEKSGMKRSNQLYKDLIKIKWVAVDDLIQHIEDSRSPDGDYPDADCIIRDLKEGE